MFGIFLALVIVYLGVTAVRDAQEIKRLTANPATEKARLSFYYRATIFGWASIAAIIVMCLMARINLGDIGLRWMCFEYNIWFTVGTLILCGLMFISSLYQMFGYLFSVKFREAVQNKFAEKKDSSQYDHISDFLVPRRGREKRWFFWVALTAGIGEELLLRGFLFFLLQAVFPAISVIVVLVLSGVLFGLWHFYQGVYGMIKTAVIGGAFFGCLYLVTGSLILPILLHFVADFSAAFILSDKDEAA